MFNNSQINQWLWKWHIIAGLITLPFILLLAITGTIYLFKSDVNEQVYKDVFFVKSRSLEAIPLPYTEQLMAAKLHSSKEITGVDLPESDEYNTGFKLKGKGRASEVLYIDPYTGELTGKFSQQQTLMHKVRKLHGELLLGKLGTLAIELVASWFIVLLLTGIYIWWPKKAYGGGVFTIRFKGGKRLFWRDVHAVGGFWLSLFLLLIIAGGMPWTDVFGDNLKWLQKQTDSGYPQHWQNAKGLSSGAPYPINSKTPISLDNAIKVAKDLNLKGSISITLPNSDTGVFTLSNRALWLADQHVIHIDQFTGKTVKSLAWKDVGILMELRQFFMRLHQGEYGLANWLGVLLVAVLFTLTTVGGLLSYLKRKPAGRWGLPSVPASFHVDKILFSIIILLGALFPMLGGSLILLVIWEKVRQRETS